MAFNWFSISSQGVYDGPTVTSARRAALAVSQGLLNITLPAPPAVTAAAFYKFSRGAAKKFIAGSKIFLRP